MAFILLLALGVVQAALLLYARNVVISSAHEGARAAVELGRDPDDASQIARQTIARSAGGLVDDLRVEVAVGTVNGSERVRVHVRAGLSAVGPLPLQVPVDATATASTERRP